MHGEEVQRAVAKCMPWILLFSFFFTFNENAFNLIAPNLSNQFGISPSTVSLVVTAGKLSFGITSIVFAALSDFVSIRKMILFTCYSFPIVTLLGVFSEYSFALLVIFRILFCATISAPVALQIIIAMKYCDKLTAAKYFGYNTAVYQIASASGNLFAGYITEYLHWNMTFLLPLITLIGVPVILKNLPKDESKKGSFDFIGIILVTVITAGLIIFMTFKMKYPLFLIVSLVCMAVFYIHMVKSKNPLIKIELFKVKGVVWSLIVCLLFYGTEIGFTFLFPFIITKIYGMSVSTLGVFFTITNIAAFITGMMTGRMIKLTGYRNITLLGGLLIFSGLAMVALLVGYSAVFMFLGMGLFNIGYTLFFAGYLTNYTQLLPLEQRGVGVGLEKLVMNIGSSLGGAFIAMLYGQPFMNIRIIDFSGNKLTAPFSNASLILMFLIALATIIFVKVFDKKFNKIDRMEALHLE
ncbi:DHA2 family metal-tetracycline-proton antiporter-like MFS transporter [Scopulibacillus daqui]|uniref:DHA2 family metal-tetracycline-proton antiporter-like MFS transporter n=1 Tax=Scopulibacillus daqui TaxID=1469162 RepID=A0ABS2Q225_9BACL|nr:MFS transporter [Scopulibacillus daqui]MBM7646256.1 DHA2 family metal-tetracycline-proton antiporter-like MFS transporter [Scopulibacillus daqui]